eukprot:8761319-Pyramimonas_sp.AAC.1
MFIPVYSCLLFLVVPVYYRALGADHGHPVGVLARQTVLLAVAVHALVRVGVAVHALQLLPVEVLARRAHPLCARTHLRNGRHRSK